MLPVRGHAYNDRFLSSNTGREREHRIRRTRRRGTTKATKYTNGVIREVIPHIEAHYSTARDAAGRSSGGFKRHSWLSSRWPGGNKPHSGARGTMPRLPGFPSRASGNGASQRSQQPSHIGFGQFQGLGIAVNVSQEGNEHGFGPRFRCWWVISCSSISRRPEASRWMLADWSRARSKSWGLMRPCREVSCSAGG